MGSLAYRSSMSVFSYTLRRNLFSVSRDTLKNKHFWLIIVVVFLVATAHSSVEVTTVFPVWRLLYFVPTSMFLVPVTYAALNFGLKGALATALLCTITAIPNWVSFHQGWGRFGCIFQVTIVDAAAYFIGQRVDRERSSRRRLEMTRVALDASESKYRSLFESSPVAILLLDSHGNITDANPAAGVLFERTPQNLKGALVADMVGGETMQNILTAFLEGRRQVTPLTFSLREGSKVYLRPMLTRVVDTQGRQSIQVVFWDVTEERRHQAGLRSYAVHLLNTMEEERQMIAHELHDETVQQLALLCRELDSVTASDKPLAASDVERLKGARKIAEDGVQWLRDFIRMLRPPILDDLGVVASIRRLLADFKDRTGTDVHFKIVGEAQRLSQERELGIFRIAQEALWNIEHHARATHVIVILSFREHEVSLEVVDNGIGFDVPATPTEFTASGHFGLLGMQERTESMGGKLKVRSGATEGTKITVSIPLINGTTANVTDH